MDGLYELQQSGDSRPRYERERFVFAHESENAVPHGRPLTAVSSGTASAQQSVTEVLSFLMTNRTILTDDFDRDASAAAETRDTIANFLSQLATLPGVLIRRFHQLLPCPLLFERGERTGTIMADSHAGDQIAIVPWADLT